MPKPVKPAKKTPEAVKLARRRTEALSPARRSEIASLGAKARWGKKK